jgi:hypothetical protein
MGLQGARLPDSASTIASMSPAMARAVTVFLLAVLFVGTLMPGSWKDAATTRVGSPLNLSAAAHVVLFAALAFVQPLCRWRGLTRARVPLAGLVLALLTEGLQFLAIDRHPNLAGVMQDLLGTGLGWWASGFLAQAPQRRGKVPASAPAAAGRLRSPSSPVDRAVPSTTTAPQASIQPVTGSSRKTAP